MNLLLWGPETWLLRKPQLDKLEVFLHQSIRRILQISMTTVQEQRLRNGKIRDMFYSFPCVRNMIVARQMDYVEKMIRGPPCPSRNMITACCEHKRHKQRERTSWSKIFASFFKTSQLSRPTDMAPYAAGFMKHQMRNTGADL